MTVVAYALERNSATTCSALAKKSSDKLKMDVMSYWDNALNPRRSLMYERKEEAFD